MNLSHFVRQSWLTFCLAVIAACGFARTPQEYRPEYSQPGKDVVWAPTRQPLVEKMLDMAEVTPKDYVIDLGSGDGRTVIAAARRGARALGIEYNPDLVELSKRNASQKGVGDKAQFVQADVFESDFSQATVITLFMGRTINLKLRPKILDLRPGTRVVSNTFTMGDWTADETAKLSDGCRGYCTALLWIVPAKVEGTWQLPQGELTLKQDFQMISGMLKSGSGTMPIKNGRLRGDEISFTAGDTQYTGQIKGNLIEGTVKSGASNSSWNATRTPG
jgi:precorrin-6B methylase 2